MRSFKCVIRSWSSIELSQCLELMKIILSNGREYLLSRSSHRYLLHFCSMIKKNLCVSAVNKIEHYGGNHEYNYIFEPILRL